MAQSVTVFIVEGSPSVRECLADLISEEGPARIIGYADKAADAMREIVAQHPDVTLVDISLRDGSGVDLLASIKRRCPATTAVVLSNEAQPPMRSRCRHRGVDHFFDVTIDIGEVVALLRRLAQRGAGGATG